MSLSRKFRRQQGGPSTPPPPPAWPPGDTKTTLVADLEQKPETPNRNALIELARAGHYHDFETELATPKVQLYMDLRAAGYGDLAEKVKDGGYDNEKPTVEQAEELRAELGAELYDAVMGTPPRGQG